MGDDKQPLLSSKNKAFSDNETDEDDIGSDKQLSVKSLLEWRRWFGKKKDGSTEHRGKDAAVGVLQMFRFADRIDLLLMLIGTCITIVETFVFVAILVLYGRLTGLFAMESFADTCRHQQQNSMDTMKNNITCPLGIDLNSVNFAHLHKLCQHSDVIVASTLAASVSSFREKVMHIVHWLFILSIAEFCGIAIGTSLWMIAIRRQICRMNILLFRSLLQRNIAYFDTIPTGQANAKLLSSIKTIEMGIGVDFKLLIITFTYIVGSLITSLFVSWQLTLIMFCIIPVVFGSAFIFNKIMANEETNTSNAHSKVGQIVEEVFSSLRTVLSFNGGRYEQQRYEEELHRTRWNTMRKGAAYGIYIGWFFFVTYIIYFVGFIFGSILMSYEDQNRFNISDILVIVPIFAFCAQILANSGTYFQSLSEARAASVSVFGVIDQANDASINEMDVWREEEIADAEWTSNINGDVEFDHVNFIYPSRREVSVLRDLSLIARVGQTTALVGSSGCGKSTCVSLLLRQYEVSSGRIKINGRSITNYPLKQLRQNIGVVSQEPILFNMSIYENIRFGKVNASRAEIEEAARQANAHNFIMQLPDKYETLVGERGVQLSGGEKQRIALARALVKQPSILLLDEATSALDNVSEKIVQEALDQACKNRTTIVIAHRLTTIRNAHQIYVLENGSVCEEGTHEILMSKEEGKYQAMVRRQQLERTNNDVIDTTQETEESEQSILSPRRRLFSDGAAGDINEKNSASPKRKSLFLRLLSMSRPEWMIISIGCIVCAMNGVAQTIFAILLAKIVNAFDYCASFNNHRVLILSCLFLLLGLFLFILRILQYTVFALTGSRLAERIRVKTFACLLRQEMAYFDRSENSSGAISIRLSSDAAALEQMVGTRLGVICEALAVTCFGFLFGIFFSWQLTMVVSVMFLIILLASYLNIHFSRLLSQQSDAILQRANTFAIEFIHSMRTIKQLSAEKEILGQYSDAIHQISRMSRKLDSLIELTFAILWAIEPCFLALLYWCALILYEKNELASKDIIMVFSFAMFATQSLKVVGMLARRIGQSLSAAQNFFDLFDRTPTIDNASSEGQELVNFRGDITFDQVKFVYPSRSTSVVLNQLQFTIRSGQRVALVGTSGCGKSTIIQLLERFYDVTQGRLLLDGIDIRQLNIQWVRSRLGLVSQEPVLFNLTIAENIAYGLENVPMEDIINAAAKANIDQFIQQLPQGYETQVGVKGCFLSGGEKQRIAIARVLLRRPKVLLLDEATSALDSYNEQIVQQALEQAQTEDPSRTSLIIAHRLSTICSCDLICVLDAGRIVESGTHTELMEQRGIYYRMLTQHSDERHR